MPTKKLPNVLLLANIGFLITHLIWGAAGPVIKFSLEYIPPFTLLFLRFLIVCAILLPYMLVKLTEVKVSKKDYLNLLLLGLLAQGSIAIIFVALKYTTALDASIISVITGALTVYAGHYFYKEKVHGLVTTGLIITILGTLAVILTPLFFGVNSSNIPTGERLFGNVLALIYNVIWVFYVVWSKMILSHKNSANLTRTLKLIKIKPIDLG